MLQISASEAALQTFIQENTQLEERHNDINRETAVSSAARG